MAEVTFNAESLGQMRRLQSRVVDALLPFKANTEAGLMAFACIRCARVLLRLYPKATRDMLIRLCCDYLQGRTSPLPVLKDATDPADRLIH